MDIPLPPEHRDDETPLAALSDVRIYRVRTRKQLREVLRIEDFRIDIEEAGEYPDELVADTDVLIIAAKGVLQGEEAVVGALRAALWDDENEMDGRATLEIEGIYTDDRADTSVADMLVQHLKDRHAAYGYDVLEAFVLNEDPRDGDFYWRQGFEPEQLDQSQKFRWVPPSPVA